MSLEAFRRIQISNPENTPGSAEAAVEPYLGVIGIPAGGEIKYRPMEERNTLARNIGGEQIDVGVEWRGTITGDLNFRHINWDLAMTVRGNVTPSGSSSEYTWAYEPALTTRNTPDAANGVDTFTIEYGDDTQAYESEFVVGTKLTIEGQPNQPIKRTLELLGRQRTDTTFTGALTYSSGSSMQRSPFNLAEIYIDTTGASLGTTQKQGLLKAFTFEYESGFTPRFAADGQLYFYQLDEERKAPRLTLTYARGSDCDAERTKYEANTTTFIELQLVGQTALDSNVPHLYIDGAYEYVAWPEVSQESGLTTVQVVAEGVYDATWAKMVSFSLLTNLVTWPT